MSFPKVVSREEWLEARLELLEREKEVTKARDEIHAARQALPAVKIEKDYRFTADDGSELTLLDLFDGRRQLIVRHFMWAPGNTVGCPGCSMQTDSIGALEHIWARDTSLVLVSRAEVHEFQAFKKRMGWTIPWHSSFGSDFNYDFEVSSDKGESPGVSAFIRNDDGEVFHTYSVYDRGGEIFKNFYNYLDITHLGRQEAQLEHPWDWWRIKDEYDKEDAHVAGDNHWNGTRFKKS
ncbi:MAG TPA: DUF899 domain-containing protein [Actinophytocola sp.]|jgi:predicted dithiol-disulfide oxidoreductase (DUF899 family)|uniref:DUF899 domain-containing protein n=1 Tax=Actinophytocola sp. TaxID=1872138 RepID=UPI002E052CAB|nr:DUF899 domain-containing protein [Actinophytocola sp.]